ncbi:MAG: peptidylprolyl isomerase [Ignavibacteriales bacterium]|nr:peptidylprolyl isomerase [Ignavibacteriales bacterium]
MFLNSLRNFFLKTVFLGGILTSLLCAQYSKDDYELVKTTFTRTFDPEIINKYLYSENPQKVKAGLFSVSHCNNQSFVNEIANLDFNSFGDLISFTLSQLGESKISTEFLFSKLLENSKYQRSIFEAIGKTGTKETLELLLNKYFIGKEFDFTGISLTIANFNSRGIKVTDGKDIELLQKEFTSNEYPIQRKIDALFALYRIGPQKLIQSDLVNLLNERDFGEESIILKQYALSSLRKLEYFTDDFPMVETLLHYPDWRIRTEAAKVICYYKFKNKDELKKYLSLLNDENPNVARQTAIALKNVSIDSTLQNYLKSEIWNCLLNHSAYTANTIGELFITYCHLYPQEIFEAIRQLSGKVKRVFFYSSLSENFTFPHQNLDYLLKEFPRANKNEKLEILNALISLQKFFPQNPDFRKILLGNLNSSDPSVISTTADGLDSVFIANNRENLSGIILNLTKKYLDNPKYSESIISLVNLSKKINDEFPKKVLTILENSESFTLRKFYCKESGVNFNETKPLENFDQLWKFAFKYKKAIVNTSKGNFIIEFNPEVSPISVGNFCYLASKKFYNNLIFHRVVPNFVIQTGDPESTGWGGPGYEINSEFSAIPFNRSYVGMASSGKDTEGSQWFVMHSYFPHLYGRYSNFGKVVKGMDTVDMIDQGDKIIKIELQK